MSDPMIELLAQLPAAEPGQARTETLKRRCRARLARQAQRPSAPRAPVARGFAKVWQPLIAFLGVVYLADVIVEAIGVLRLQ
jgi:hypothetical protein